MDRQLVPSLAPLTRRQFSKSLETILTPKEIRTLAILTKDISVQFQAAIRKRVRFLYPPLLEPIFISFEFK